MCPCITQASLTDGNWLPITNMAVKELFPSVGDAKYPTATVVPNANPYAQMADEDDDQNAVAFGIVAEEPGNPPQIEDGKWPTMIFGCCDQVFPSCLVSSVCWCFPLARVRASANITKPEWLGSNFYKNIAVFWGVSFEQESEIEET